MMASDAILAVIIRNKQYTELFMMEDTVLVHLMNIHPFLSKLVRKTRRLRQIIHEDMQPLF